MSTKKNSGSKTSKKNKGKKEIWKSLPVPIKELKDRYQVSNMGQIRNKETNKILKSNLRSGYLSNSYTSGKIKKSYKVHRLVAKAFIKNTDPNKKWVNHIDGNKINNKMINLEWCTARENNNHAVEHGLRKLVKKKIIRYDPTAKSPDDVRIYDSLIEASKDTKINETKLVSACNPNNKEGFTGGYYWRYVDEDPNRTSDIDFSEYKQIIDFPNYIINKEGKIYSLSYKKFMKFQNHSGDAGKMVQLYNGTIQKDFLIHRLVAQYFLEKKKSKYHSVHHIDRDKTNNHIDNLEWCHVPGVEKLESKYEAPYYDPKTAIEPKKKKLLSSGPKDLLTANRKNLSKKQREEQDRLRAEMERKKKPKKIVEI